MDISFIHFKCPFTCQVSGPTNSGKTQLVRRLLKYHNLVFNKQNKCIRVIWAYSVWQDLYDVPIDDSVNIEYIKGIPTDEELSSYKTDILVLDDLMNQVKNDENFSDFFSKGRHKVNYGIIFITQNMFLQGSQMRNVRLNCLYYICMKSLQSKQQLHTLSRQLFPGKSKYIMEAYEDATKDKPYSYIRLDLTLKIYYYN
jgi:hypothetical protein